MKTNTTFNENNKFAILVFISILSLSIRLFFFNGPTGSDDITYLERSLDIANGTWSSANYNGALRYGYNIPSGFLIYLFGLNVFTANLWALLSSLIEIGAVFIFAWKHIGHKAAFFSAILLAFIPLHIAVATRLHSDPVVSMFLTLSFITFYEAERQSNKRLYFITGILLGCVFWTKELVALVFFSLLLYPIFIRKIKVDWLYLALGGILMLLGHFILMKFIAGDPLHAIKTVFGQVKSNFIDSGSGDDSPWSYFYDLFVNLKYTWLTPILAILGGFFLSHSVVAKKNAALKFTAFWLISLLLVLSFFPVSFHPFRFAMKQYNYMSLFLAPIAIIAGTALSLTFNKIRLISSLLIFTTLLGDIVLSAVLQQSYQIRDANSRGVLAFSEKHLGQNIYGTVKNWRIACFYKILNDRADNKLICDKLNIQDYSKVPNNIPKTENIPVFTVIDTSSMGFFAPDIEIGKPHACWHEIGNIIPAEMGYGHFVIDIILSINRFLPANLEKKFLEIQKPKPAIIYTANLADLWCKSVLQPQALNLPK